MGSHQGSVEGKENLSQPAGHTPPNASQDPISFLLPCNPADLLLVEEEIERDKRLAYFFSFLRKTKEEGVCMED